MANNAIVVQACWSFCAAGDRLLASLASAEDGESSWRAGEASGLQADSSVQMVAAVQEARRHAALRGACSMTNGGDPSVSTHDRAADLAGTVQAASGEIEERCLRILSLAAPWVGACTLSRLQSTSCSLDIRAIVRRAILEASAAAAPSAEPPSRISCEALLPYEHARRLADECRRASGSAAAAGQAAGSGTIGMIPTAALHAPGDTAWLVCAALGIVLQRAGTEAAAVEACDTLRRFVEQAPMHVVRAARTGAVAGISCQLNRSGSAKFSALSLLRALLRPRPRSSGLVSEWNRWDLVPLLEAMHRSNICKTLVDLLHVGDPGVKDAVIRVLEALGEVLCQPRAALDAELALPTPARVTMPGRVTLVTGEAATKASKMLVPPPCVEAVLVQCAKAGCVAALLDALSSEGSQAAASARTLYLLVLQARHIFVNDFTAFVKSAEVSRMVAALHTEAREVKEHIVELLVLISYSRSGAEAVVAGDALPTLLDLLHHRESEVRLGVATMLDNLLLLDIPGVGAAAAKAGAIQALDALAFDRPSWPQWAREDGEATDALLVRVRAALLQGMPDATRELL